MKDVEKEGDTGSSDVGNETSRSGEQRDNLLNFNQKNNFNFNWE